jgi:hypothetical protein
MVDVWNEDPELLKATPHQAGTVVASGSDGALDSGHSGTRVSELRPVYLRRTSGTDTLMSRRDRSVRLLVPRH